MASAIILPTSRIEVRLADLPAKVAGIVAQPPTAAVRHRADEYLLGIRRAWPTRKPRLIAASYRSLVAYAGGVQ